MYLDSVIRAIEKCKTFGGEDLFKLNEAIFNLPEEDTIDDHTSARLFKLLERMSAHYSTGKHNPADQNVFYDYVALLSTMQNQWFFGKQRSRKILQWLQEALDGGEKSSAKPSKAVEVKGEIPRLEEENARLEKEIMGMMELSKAVETFQRWQPPEGSAAAQARAEAKGKAKAKAKAKEKDKAEAKESMPRLAPLVPPEGGLSVTTWNISAVNTNPFEYWITHDDPFYEKLMADVEGFIDAPGDRDIPAGDVFNEAFFVELKGLMEKEGWEGIGVAETFWREDLSKRKIISGFLKDKSIGSKRLASMPDRFTNTIRVVGKKNAACRPTVINLFKGKIPSLERWWPLWRDFMFKDAIILEGDGEAKSVRPCEMLQTIKKDKYPAVTEEEEQASLALQALCMAVFDAVMVHMMLTLSPEGHWQKIRRSIDAAIYAKKNQSTIDILRGVCAGADVICLQECALAFRTNLEKALGSKYHIVAPEDVDPKRDQNSMVLLRKGCFPDGASTELTKLALEALPKGSAVARGDLIVLSAVRRGGSPVLVASFHGDTNGLATKPVVSAVTEILKKQAPGCRLVFGLDANVYLEKAEGWQDVGDFMSHCASLGLRSCWPEGKEMSECCTTCHARTYLQPQLNKAVRSADKLSKGDVSPKDHILVQSDAFDVDSCIKDNTGERRYAERECFPSVHFPSDHGVVAAVLRPKAA